MTDSTANNYRSPIINESHFLPQGQSSDMILRTPIGNVRAMPPPLPQAPMGSMPQYASSGYGGNYGMGYGNFGGLSNSFGSAMGGYGGLGGGYGGYGYGGIGGYGGAYNRFGGGTNPMDPESRFIQLAEANSRPAFESIGSLVSAFGNIAAMLDSTFFALTSSFRAILGVAANFRRLRGVFAQFWQTFAVFRGLTWIYRKLLYWLRISDMDPSSKNFKKAFSEALSQAHTQPGAPTLPRKGQSPWPVLAFLSFIFTAPYLIMKLLGTVTNTAQEESRNPSKWVQPIETIALYDFQARNPGELTITAGDRILIAPKEIQNTQGLLNTGWGLATIDGQTSGLVPINYVKNPQQMRQERQKLDEHPILNQSDVSNPQPELMNLSPAAFPAPPVEQLQPTNVGTATQPAPPATTEMILDGASV